MADSEIRVPDGCPLSAREWQTLSRLARGQTLDVIAAQLEITLSTARTFVSRAIHRLDVANRVQAVAICHEAGWLDNVDNRWADERVTPAQRLYLDAFDKFLAARHKPREQTRARAEMSHHLTSMCLERQTPRPAGRDPSRSTPFDPMEAVMGVLQEPG